MAEDPLRQGRNEEYQDTMASQGKGRSRPTLSRSKGRADGWNGGALLHGSADRRGRFKTRRGACDLHPPWSALYHRLRVLCLLRSPAASCSVERASGRCSDTSVVKVSNSFDSQIVVQTLAMMAQASVNVVMLVFALWFVCLLRTVSIGIPCALESVVGGAVLAHMLAQAPNVPDTSIRENIAITLCITASGRCPRLRTDHPAGQNLHFLQRQGHAAGPRPHHCLRVAPSRFPRRRTASARERRGSG